MNSEREKCYKMSNEELEDHIRSIEARIEQFVQSERTKLASARAVRAERFEKMSEDERRELRKYQIAKDPNGRKAKPQTNKADKATQMANKLGVSKADLMALDFDDLVKKFKKAKGNGGENPDPGKSGS
jgi:hypothetical protein